MGPKSIPADAAAILARLPARQTRIRRMYAAFVVHADGTGTVRGFGTDAIARTVGLDGNETVGIVTRLQALGLIRLDGFSKSLNRRCRSKVRLWVVVHKERDWLDAVRQGGL
jgi:hypothetical protein